MAVNSKIRPQLRKKMAKKRGLFSVSEGRIDYVFLLLVMVILVVGMVSLFSASFATAYRRFNNSFRFIKSQMSFAVIGTIVMLLISTINYRIYEKILWPFYTITTFLLILVYFMPKISGVQRWIVIGGEDSAFTFQPSEIAKFLMVILVSHLISLNSDKMNDLKKGIIPILVTAAPIILLVLFETHISAAIILCGIVAALIFCGGTDIRWFILLAATAAIIFWIIVKSNAIEYAGWRFVIWKDPYNDGENGRGLGFQTIQSLNAIGSGGLMGEGIGNSIMKYRYLPELYNDYIFQ